MDTNMNRRGFIERAAGVAAGVVAAGAGIGARATRPDAAVAAAPVAPTPARIGLQLYTVRERVDVDILKTIEDVNGVGYKFVEFAGYGKVTPAQVRAKLDALKMKAPSTHISLDALRKTFDQQAGTAEIVGHEYVTIPSFGGQNDMPLTADEWKRAADEFNAIGAKLKARKMRLGFHSHRDEFMPAGAGKTGMDILIANTDPDLVVFEIDLGWARVAGQDPAAWFRKYPGRFRMWHVKDILALKAAQDRQQDTFKELVAKAGQARTPPAPPPPAPDGARAGGGGRGNAAPPAITGGPVPIGAGEIDFAPIVKEWKVSGLEYFFVEQDSGPTWPGGSLAAITTSYRNLANILR